MDFSFEYYVFLYTFLIDKGPIHEYYVPNVTKQHHTVFI
jgi:hypothetical protein